MTNEDRTLTVSQTTYDHRIRSAVAGHSAVLGQDILAVTVELRSVTRTPGTPDKTAEKLWHGLVAAGEFLVFTKKAKRNTQKMTWWFSGTPEIPRPVTNWPNSVGRIRAYHPGVTGMYALTGPDWQYSNGQSGARVKKPLEAVEQGLSLLLLEVRESDGSLLDMAGNPVPVTGPVIPFRDVPPLAATPDWDGFLG